MQLSHPFSLLEFSFVPSKERFVPFLSNYVPCMSLCAYLRPFSIDMSVSLTESVDSKPAEPLGPDRGMMLNSGGFLFCRRSLLPR
jgi:hypothetical protein